MSMHVQLLSPEDVATHCGLSRKAVYRAIDRGELKAARLCSRLRIRPSDVEAWVEANSVAQVGNVKSLTPPGSPAPNGLRSLLEERH
jgi:excisionase family DNA binding protein